MDSFYKLKDGMTEQPKKILSELAKAYGASLKDYKRQESEAKEKIDKLVVEYQGLLDKLKIARNELAESEKRMAEIKKADAVLRKEKEDAKILREKEAEGFTAHTRQIILETEDLEKKTKARREEIAELEKRIVNKIAENESVLRRDEAILAEILKAKEANRVIVQQYETLKVEADAKLEKLFSETKRLSDGKEQLKKDQDSLITKQKEIEEQVKNNQQFEDILKIRKKQLDDKEQVLSDRELDADVRDVELSKKENRINNLIEVHKIK